MNARDVKILITGKGKTTGTGKTTLALHLADFINKVRNDLFDLETEWNSQEYSFMNVWEYLKKYKEADPGDPLITDEIEYLLDRRSHQSRENKKFSQAWSVLRWKNVVTIATAPGLSDVEKRIPEGADIWINVVFTGKANVYYMMMDDFKALSGSHDPMIVKRSRIGKYKESLLWNDIGDSDDYKWLKEKKADIGVPGIDDNKEKQIEEKDLNKLERNIRNQYVEDTIKILDDKGVLDRITQTEIANISGVSQPQVSKLMREMKKNGEIEV